MGSGRPSIFRFIREAGKQHKRGFVTTGHVYMNQQFMLKKKHTTPSIHLDIMSPRNQSGTQVDWISDLLSCHKLMAIFHACMNGNGTEGAWHKASSV
jgi:hypothetical protein